MDLSLAWAHMALMAVAAADTPRWGHCAAALIRMAKAIGRKNVLSMQDTRVKWSQLAEIMEAAIPMLGHALCKPHLVQKCLL